MKHNSVMRRRRRSVKPACFTGALPSERVYGKLLPIFHGHEQSGLKDISYMMFLSGKCFFSATDNLE